MSGPRDLATSAALYGRSAVRIARRRRRLGREERLVFVVGSPRSGTTFTGSALGSLPGFVDLDEVQPWKAAIPGLLDRPDEESSRRGCGASSSACGGSGSRRGLRGVEQTPETSFVLAAALLAYPEAVAVHVMRDGRDVVTSLLERGWLSAERTGADDARLPTAPMPASGSSGAARRSSPRSPTRRAPPGPGAGTSTAARAVPERTVEVRYEQLVADPAGAAAPVAERLGVAAGPVAEAFSAVHDRSAGRWRRDLTAEQLADVEREAGETLAALGYELS